MDGYTSHPPVSTGEMNNNNNGQETHTNALSTHNSGTVVQSKGEGGGGAGGRAASGGSAGGAVVGPTVAGDSRGNNSRTNICGGASGGGSGGGGGGGQVLLQHQHGNVVVAANPPTAQQSSSLLCQPSHFIRDISHASSNVTGSHKTSGSEPRRDNNHNHHNNRGGGGVSAASGILPSGRSNRGAKMGGGGVGAGGGVGLGGVGGAATTAIATTTTTGVASRGHQQQQHQHQQRGGGGGAGGGNHNACTTQQQHYHQQYQHQQAGGSSGSGGGCYSASSSSAGGHSSGNAGGAGGGGAATSTVMPCDEETKAAFTKEWQALEHDNLSSADYYFNSYAHFGIHEEMLKDTVRTGCYQRAICQNSHLFVGKIVLDVGSGTGILSLFAARAGAAHVYGIECSEIIHTARKIVAANGYTDTITFIQGKAEDVELPVSQVDIIISEWMGYFLLYESMLDTVIYCRDRWLIPGGMIFPDKSALYLAAIEDADYKEEKIGYWKNVYGFNFECVSKCVMEDPLVDTVEENAVVTTGCCILKLDLKTCTKADLDFCAPYQLTLRRKDFVHAFDVLVAEAGDKIEGMIAVKKSKKNPRDLDIKLSYNFRSKNAPHKLISNTQFYRLR